jgi:hypothetical protein
MATQWLTFADPASIRVELKFIAILAQGYTNNTQKIG